MESNKIVPRFSSAGTNVSGLPDEALEVERELERDLAMFASRLAAYKNAGASGAMCESALSGTGLRLITTNEGPRLGMNLPLAGAVVSGTLSISYFLPRRSPGIPQRPVLAKTISEGSSFYIARDTDAVLTAAPNTWLVVRDDGRPAGGGRIEFKAAGQDGTDLSSLSHAELLDRITTLDFKNVSDLVASAHPILAEIASRRDLLRQLLANARRDPTFRGDCELLSEFHKYVLHRSPNDTRLRLHVFRPDADLHAHAHRWSMVSYVLSGPVMNKYYGIESEIASAPTQARVTHRLQVGSCYAFDDSLIHWFRGAPGSATLTLRGPAVKKMATEFRRTGVMSKFGVEASMEPSLTMTDEQFEYGVGHLEMTNVL